MGRLILDTGVLIAAERGKVRFRDLIRPEDDAVIAAVTVAEFGVGVRRAGSTAQRAIRQAFLDDLLRLLPVEDYTPAVAERHADLLTWCASNGVARGAFDLIIAAHALVTSRVVLTTDKEARFGELPGVAEEHA